MKKYAIYLLIYSILGFILERLINLIFLGTPYDNSVLVGPYQPLYGAGITGLIILNDTLIRRIKARTIRWATLLVLGIVTTGLSELISGVSYEFLTGRVLWDYGQTFKCAYPYVCLLPTSLFGLLSAFAVLWIHPKVVDAIKKVPPYILIGGGIIFFVDYLFTIVKLILSA